MQMIIMEQNRRTMLLPDSQNLARIAIRLLQQAGAPQDSRIAFFLLSPHIKLIIAMPATRNQHFKGSIPPAIPVMQKSILLYYSQAIQRAASALRASLAIQAWTGKMLLSITAKHHFRSPESIPRQIVLIVM
jgi:hypothetical protein